MWERGWTKYALYAWAARLSRRRSRAEAYRLAERLSFWFYLCDSRGRRGVGANLARIHAALGRPLPPSAARRTFANFSRYLVDFFRFSADEFSALEPELGGDSFDVLDELRAAGKGVVLITAHLGNWELGGLALAAAGYPLNVVYLPSGNRRLDEFFAATRQRRGLRTIPLGRAARESLRALRRNECIALLADRDFTAHGATVSLFGAPARLPSGPALLAWQTGAPILPGCALRRADGLGYDMKFFDPIVPAADGAPECLQDPIARRLETMIAADPCQWFVFEDFWRPRAAPARRPRFG